MTGLTDHTCRADECLHGGIARTRHVACMEETISFTVCYTIASLPAKPDIFCASLAVQLIQHPLQGSR